MHDDVSSPDRTRIAAHAMMDARTVTRAYKGEPVYSTTRARIEHAARYLGLPLPPQPNPDRRRTHAA